MVLSREEVIRLARTKRLLTPFDPGNMGPSSYDLTVGAEYYTYDASDNEKFVTRQLEKEGQGSHFLMLPNEAAFVLTEETVSVPSDLVGVVSLRFGLTKVGIMLSPQAPIDPGYSGKIMMMLYNLSDEVKTFARGDRFVTITFHRLEVPTAPYGGPNQGVTTIAGFVGRPKVLRTSIAMMQEALDQQQESLRQQRLTVDAEIQRMRANNGRTQTTILTIVAVLVAIATVLAAIVPFYQSAVRDGYEPTPAPTVTVFVTPSPAPSETSLGLPE